MLVIGATGGTGLEVVRQAQARGITVTALVRKAEDAALLPAGTRIHVGDARDTASVTEALAGQDCVVSTLGARKGTDVGTVRSDGTEAIVKAMRQAGVKRLVAVTSVGVGSSLAHMSGASRFMWPRIVGKARLAEADRAEQAIMGSGLAWTIVRPPRLVDAAKTSEVSVGPEVAVSMQSQITRTALAGVLLDLATSGQAVRETVTVTLK
jgi:putative NADH-flavin reductase